MKQIALTRDDGRPRLVETVRGQKHLIKVHTGHSCLWGSTHRARTASTLSLENSPSFGLMMHLHAVTQFSFAFIHGQITESLDVFSPMNSNLTVTARNRHVPDSHASYLIFARFTDSF